MDGAGKNFYSLNELNASGMVAKLEGPQVRQAVRWFGIEISYPRIDGQQRHRVDPPRGIFRVLDIAEVWCINGFFLPSMNIFSGSGYPTRRAKGFCYLYPSGTNPEF